MYINSISQNSNNLTFGEIILGRGGAKRLAKTMHINDAKTLIRNNIFNSCDILITENSTEVIPQNKKTIMNITKAIANSKDFTDVEIFEHGKRGIFKLMPGVSEAELDKYGHENRDISLAEKIAKIINTNYKWPELIRCGEKSNPAEAVSSKLDETAREIEIFNENCYKF